jgi:16S rRNA (uracil1498-N3)-methyltransferase
MRYFLIEESTIKDRKAVVTGSDAKHIKTVLRLNTGDPIGLYDGKGTEYEAKIEAISRQGIALSILRSYPSASESPVQITVAQALLKDRKMDSLLRQLTELGVLGWMPFIASRSVPRPDQRRTSARRIRWQTITREALKQCRRGRAVKIHPVQSLEEVLTLPEAFDLKIIFHEGSVQSLKAAAYPEGGPFRTILLILGPEGGFTDDEIDRARAEGFVIAGLGPRILKAETATIAACSLVQYLFGDMGL